MNFQPALAQAVMEGRKTVTRRLANDNPRSPWFEGRCGLLYGRDYAVCPGRGKPAIGRVLVKSVFLVRLGRLPLSEALLEGFPSVAAFEQTFAWINGSYDPDVRVWRIGFRVLGSDAA